MRPTFHTNKQRILVAIGVAICVYLWGHFISTYTDAKQVFLDATTSGISVVAQYIMSWKKLESWILWITVDVLSIILFILVGAWMAAALYAVFLCLATKGLLEWWDEYNYGGKYGQK